MNTNHIKTFGQFVNESTEAGWDPTTISSVQGKLAVTKTGKLDTATIQALKGYQEGHSISVTGKIDKATLASMGIKGKWVDAGHTSAERKAGMNSAIR
jgi:hypothetical protein